MLCNRTHVAAQRCDQNGVFIAHTAVLGFRQIEIHLSCGLALPGRFLRLRNIPQRSPQQHDPALLLPPAQLQFCTQAFPVLACVHPVILVEQSCNQFLHIGRLLQLEQIRNAAILGPLHGPIRSPCAIAPQKRRNSPALLQVVQYLP